MAPRDQDSVSTVPSTEAPVYTKPVLRSYGSVAEQLKELAVVDDATEEAVGPAEDAATSYLSQATDYLASFKAGQLGLKAAGGVLDTLDRATLCEDDCVCEVDCDESLTTLKFDEINFDVEGYNSEADSDYCPSEDCSDDDLEYDSEVEVSDAEADEVCEKAKANNYVRSLLRRCRAVGRAGTKRAGAAQPVETIGEASLVGKVCEAFSINSFLSVVGLKLEPVIKMIAKVIEEAEAEEHAEEVSTQKFCELDFKNYDSDEDADYCPSETEEDSELEYDSEAGISDSEAEISESDEDTEVSTLKFCELDLKDYDSDEDADYCASKSEEDSELEGGVEAETYTKPVLRSSNKVAALIDGLNLKDYEEDSELEYDSEDEVSEESDEEHTEEVSTQKFCEFKLSEFNFEDYNSEEDADYCPELEDDAEADIYTKPVLRSSGSVAGLNNGLIFKDYKEDVDYCPSESEEDSELESDSESEVSELESDSESEVSDE